MQTLKDLEHQTILEAETLGLPRQFPSIGPEAVHGIELNPYAAELARVTVWIGEIQWMLQHGYDLNRNPVLRPLDTIEQRDALLSFSPLPVGEGPGERAIEAQWPEADVIIGNPPFLGGSKLLGGLGEEYTQTLRACYQGRVPGGADLVCYWFEKARAQIETGKAQRAGLVATQSIRNGANRKVLERINETGRIFHAWGDEPWINEGAAVRVSLVGFSGKDETLAVVLDGKPAHDIYSDLTTNTKNTESIDLTQVRPLKENSYIAFQGPEKNGAFDISGDLARSWINLPNPNGKPNADILKPRWNGIDLTRKPQNIWIIDFGTDITESNAALYEAPFQHILKHVKPERDNNRDQNRKRYWWRFGRTGEDMRNAIKGLPRYIATPEVAKHRVFAWMQAAILPDKKLIVIARSDDATFGLVHSRIHQVWSLGMCTWHGAGNDPRYTPTTTFETFPFPMGVLTDPDPDARFPAIAEAAKRLDELRENWLNPPEWVERVPEVVPGYPDRIIPKPGHEADLKKRTLTNLYNQRP